MALSDRMEFSVIAIKADGVIEVRVDRVIMDGTEEVARQPKRFVYTPDMVVADLPAKIRPFANLVWTPAIIAAWAAAHPTTGTAPQ